VHSQAGTDECSVVAFEQLCEITRGKLQELIDAKRLHDQPLTYIKRLEYELGVYELSRYSDIILIIADYIRWADTEGVPSGPGRGSAAGSLVVYLAGITKVDPIRFGLLFERFLNPDRISQPDIDTDFASREPVVGYLKERYGSNRVVKVGVPSLFKPRSAIDEFARSLSIEYGRSKLINKLVGDAATFEEAFAATPELAHHEEEFPELFKLARQAQGLVRMTTTHPSAVILTRGPIGKEIPLQRSRGNDKELVTQWDGEELDDLGYVKLDILTIDNLAVISNAAKRVGGDFKIDFNTIELDDKKTLAGFGRGETVGVFQFEEPKSVSILRAIKDITFDDVVIVNACIRPGLDVDGFITARNDPTKIAYLISQLEPILSETYGVILYQEQVMRMCVDLAGFTMAQADGFRKIIAKTANQRVEFSQEDHDRFRQGYLANGNDPNKFSELWESILACQNYIFNKAHAVCYTYIAYADMYLKQHYPLQFMCAALQVRSREIYIDECARMGIKVLPPDVNKSDVNYTIEGDAIRMGLGAIKHVGKATKIMQCRPFRDEFDLIGRVKPSKNILQALVYSGALDSLEKDRSALAYHTCDNVERPPTVAYLANMEKECLGFYLTYNPLNGFEDALVDCVTSEGSRPNAALVGGMITKVHQHQAKTGMMAFCTLFTMSGEMEVLIWPSNYSTESSKLALDNIIIANGNRTNRGAYAIKNVRVLRSG